MTRGSRAPRIVAGAVADDAAVLEQRLRPAVEGNAAAVEAGVAENRIAENPRAGFLEAGDAPAGAAPVDLHECPVAADGVVLDHGGGLVGAGDPGPVANRVVVHDGVILNRRRRVLAVDPGALAGAVVTDRAGEDLRSAGAAIDGPVASSGGSGVERAPAQGGAAGPDVNPPAARVGQRAGGHAAGDGKAVQNGGRIRLAARDHVAAVVRAGWLAEQAAGVGDIDVVVLEVAAEDRGVTLGVAFFERGLRPGKAAIDGHVANEREGRVLPCAGGRRGVRPGGDPDLARRPAVVPGDLQRFLQRDESRRRGPGPGRWHPRR
jgi:hypothetical protein